MVGVQKYGSSIPLFFDSFNRNTGARLPVSYNKKSATHDLEGLVMEWRLYLLPILLQKKNKWVVFVYLSLVYDNSSTVKTIRKVLMSVETRQNESKRDNVGQEHNKQEVVPIIFFWNKGLPLYQTQALKNLSTQTRLLHKKLWRDCFL